MDRLRVLVFVEVASVYGLLLLLGGRDERYAWLPVLPVAALLGLIVATQISPWLGVVLSVHIVARVAGVWSDLRAARVVSYELFLSIVLMGVAWLAVGLLPLPSLGWNEAAVPSELWWEVVKLGAGSIAVPFALPAWGFLYYISIAAADRNHMAERLERRWGPLM